jgi:hypothetical protein
MSKEALLTPGNGAQHQLEDESRDWILDKG